MQKITSLFAVMWWSLSFLLAQNTSPIFTSAPVAAVDENSPYIYTVTTKDLDFDQIVVTASNLPAWLSLQQEIQVTTLAGSSNSGSADGASELAQFSYPYGVAVDDSGNVYVTDWGNHLIRKVTPAGVVSTLAGSTKGFADGIGEAAQFDRPQGIAVDGSGHVYVADRDNHRIRKITPAGEVSTLAGSTMGFANGIGIAAQFKSPAGVVVDDMGNVYVADQGNDRIRKITSGGEVSTLAGSTEGHVDGTGTAAQFDDPNGIAIDNSGNLYVSEFRLSLIRKITPAGVVTTYAGSTPGFAEGDAATAQFMGPIGLAADGSGNVYVLDQNNFRIRKITTEKVVSTLAGSTQGFADGAGTVAQFNSPLDIALGTSGAIYIVDFFNHRIRKVTQSYVLSGTPTGGQVGAIHEISLEATDGKGGVATQSFNVVVNDVTAPEVTRLFPADDAIAVSLESDLVITFSENMEKGIGSIQLKATANDETIEVIDVTTATVGIADNVVTINSVNLLPSHAYYVQIASGVFKDTAGNNYAGINDKVTWRFVTEAVPKMEMFIGADVTGTQLSQSSVIDIGTTFQTGVITQDFYVRNNGTSDLIVTDIASSDPIFKIDGNFPAQVPVDSGFGFSIVLESNIEGSYVSTISVLNNDKVLSFDVNGVVEHNYESFSLKVYNLVTPNNDGKHDFLKIQNIEYYPNNQVLIFTRWGDKVFEMRGYDNNQKVFEGIANSKNNRVLDNGTYYYMVDDGIHKMKTGFLILSN